MKEQKPLPEEIFVFSHESYLSCKDDLKGLVDDQSLSDGKYDIGIYRLYKTVDVERKTIIHEIKTNDKNSKHR